MNDEEKASKPHSKLFIEIVCAVVVAIIGIGAAWLKGCFDPEPMSKPTTQVDSSPVNDVTGDQNTIFQNIENLTYNQMIVVSAATTELIKKAPEGKTYTPQEVLDEIKKAMKQHELKTTEQEAEKQADNFLATLTFQMAKEADRKKRYNSYLEVLPEAYNIVFNEFILNYVDS